MGKYEDHIDLANKIVLIENADPGYDWLFGRNIAGLVTKYECKLAYGDKNCKFGLPAVIGVGEQKFNEIVTANVLEIDCSSQLIRKVR